MGCKECKGEIITPLNTPKFCSIQKFQPIPINKFALRVEKVYKNQQYPKKNIKFIDDIFPPNNNSIFGLNSKGTRIDKFQSRTFLYDSNFQVKSENIVWLSAKEIFNNEKYEIFKDSVEIDDIKQGTLGDCYFLSSICSMSKYPQLIYQIFRTWKVPKNGCYEVILRLNGEWKIILLDDKFPCDKFSRKPIFSKPHDNELWSMLLEKAWAKVNKGYINIIGGMVNEVLLALTPFPVFSFYHDTIFGLSEIDLWILIKDSFEKNYILTSTTIKNQDIEKKGLIKSHSYTLLQFREGIVNNILIRLIQIRNPWGYMEWKGDYCDNSPLWTEQLKQCLKIDNEDKEDGMFWMNFQDFYRLFRVTTICNVCSPNYSLTLTIPKERIDFPNIYEIYIYETINIFITAYKKSYRFNRGIPPDAKLTINLILIKKDGTDLILIDTNSSSSSNPTIEHTLSHGYYLIYVHAIMESNSFDKKRKIKLALSGSHYFNSRFIGIDNDFSFLRHIITNYLKKNNMSKHDTLFQIEQDHFFNTTYGFSYLFNQTENKMIKVEVKSKFNNFKLYTKLEKSFLLGLNAEWFFLGTKIQYHKEFTFNITFVLGVEGNNEIETREKKGKDDLSKYFEDIRYSFPTLNNFDFVFKQLIFDIKTYPHFFGTKSLVLLNIKPEEGILSTITK